MRFLFYFIFCFHFIISNSYSINYYKYPQKDLPENFCKDLYDKINFPHPNYGSEDPIKVKVDMYVDRIFEIEADKNTFKAQVNLWLTWQDPRLKLILKEMDYFTDGDQKPYYLCSYNPTNEFSNFKLFDPAIEFFNRIDKPPIENFMADWVDVFSDGKCSAIGVPTHPVQLFWLCAFFCWFIHSAEGSINI